MKWGLSSRQTAGCHCWVSQSHQCGTYDNKRWHTEPSPTARSLGLCWEQTMLCPTLYWAPTWFKFLTENTYTECFWPSLKPQVECKGEKGRAGRSYAAAVEDPRVTSVVHYKSKTLEEDWSHYKRAQSCFVNESWKASRPFPPPEYLFLPVFSKAHCSDWTGLYFLSHVY